MVKEYFQGRPLVAEGRIVAPSRLADAGLALEDVRLVAANGRLT